MFRVFVDNTLMGTSALEGGDAPMGVASGKFVPEMGLSQFALWMQSIGAQDLMGCLALALPAGSLVIAAGGEIVLSQGVSLTVALEISEVEIDVVGIPSLQYRRLFPQHMAQYESRY